MNFQIIFDGKTRDELGYWHQRAHFLEHNGRIAIGVDPGVNFGITIIKGDGELDICWGKLPTHKEPGLRGVEAYNLVAGSGKRGKTAYKAVVEGAAYYKPHGQVGLEEVRFGFFLGLYHMGFDVRILPPASIRKMAFGAGRTQAGDLWPGLNSNAADSIGCALAALQIGDNE